MGTTILPRAGRLAGALIGAGLLLSVVGCGSEDEAPPPAPADPELTLEQTADPLSNGEEPEGEEPEADAGSDFCNVLEQFGDDILSAPADPGEGTGEFVDVYREIAAAAPADAAADWNYMADAMEAMADIDYSDPDAAAQLAEFDDLGQVAERLGQQVQEECG
ncbi:MAG TPA: hypothetical protein VIP77_12610 [Jiangellaceae bacterium]